jgi:hypothetical protein
MVEMSESGRYYDEISKVHPELDNLIRAAQGLDAEVLRQLARSIGFLKETYGHYDREADRRLTILVLARMCSVTEDSGR